MQAMGNWLATHFNPFIFLLIIIAYTNLDLDARGIRDHDNASNRKMTIYKMSYQFLEKWMIDFGRRSINILSVIILLVFF